jgi:hypothetical protein
MALALLIYAFGFNREQPEFSGLKEQFVEKQPEALKTLDRKVHVLKRLQAGATEPPALTATGIDNGIDVKPSAFADAATASDEQPQIHLYPLGDEIRQEPPTADHRVAEQLQMEAESLEREIEELIFEQAELFDRLQDFDELDRAEAIPKLSTSGEGLDIIIGALAFDPDPEIRMAAAQRLSEAKGFATINGLINAIDDPEPEVSLQAIISLVNIGDRSVIQTMQQVREHHSDPAIQEALEEGIRAIAYSARMDSDGIERVPNFR